MPASAQMSCIEAPWNPDRTKQRWAAARISARRSDWACTLARRMRCSGGSGCCFAVNENERSLSIWAGAWRVKANGCVRAELQLDGLAKGSMPRLHGPSERLERLQVLGHVSG